MYAQETHVFKELYLDLEKKKSYDLKHLKDTLDGGSFEAKAVHGEMDNTFYNIVDHLKKKPGDDKYVLNAFPLKG